MFCNTKVSGDGLPLTPDELADYVGPLLEREDFSVVTFRHPSVDAEYYAAIKVSWLVELTSIRGDWVSSVRAQHCT